MKGNVSTNVYLASYMLSTYPSKVFVYEQEELEAIAKQSAMSMLVCTHETAALLSEGMSWAQVRAGVAKDLPRIMESFLDAYCKWSQTDNTKKLRDLRALAQEFDRCQSASDLSAEDLARIKIHKKHTEVSCFTIV